MLGYYSPCMCCMNEVINEIKSTVMICYANNNKNKQYECMIDKDV